jgi:hypothetical protein
MPGLGGGSKQDFRCSRDGIAHGALARLKRRNRCLELSVSIHIGNEWMTLARPSRYGLQCHP